MAMYSEGGTTSPDFLIALAVLFCTLVSVLLNPIVFIYNNSKPRSIPKFLFQVLSAADFLTSTIIGVFVASALLRVRGTDPRPPYLPLTRHETDHLVVKNITLPLKMYGITSWYIQQTPGFVAMVMAVCRFIQIKRPFQKISFRLIVGIIVGVAICNLILLSFCLTQDAMVFTYQINNLWPINGNILAPDYNTNREGYITIATYIFLTWTQSFGQPLSILVSVLTVRHLYITYNSSGNPTLSQQNGRRSSIKILLTNLSAVIETVFYLCVFSKIMTADDMLGFEALSMFSSILPVILSTLNPFVFIALTPRLLQTLRARFRPLRTVDVELSTVVTVVTRARTSGDGRRVENVVVK